MRQTMSLQSKRELLQALRNPYENATVDQKTQLLNGFLAATGYSRKHAIKLMRTKNLKRKQPIRASAYDQEVKDALCRVWQAAGCICSKRLIPFLPEFIPALERFNNITLTDETRESLLRLSAATADRMLKSERQRLGRSVSMTKRGNLLRRQIAIRTSAQWNNVEPGFFEGDLVAHNGGNPHGQFIHTLTLTDIASGWTECVSLLRKSDEEVIAAIVKVRKCLPIPLLGLDTDNGSEFINHKLSDYCKNEGIIFTRSRVFKSNDQAHVEEKNGSVVRRFVGHRRFEGKRLHQLMTDLYELTRLFVNYCQPSSKLESKNRDGGHVTKRYDKAKTPCQRLLELEINAAIKEKLRNTFETLDPVRLLTRIEAVQLELEANTKIFLKVPASTEAVEALEILVRTSERKDAIEAKPFTKAKTGRKSIISEEVRRQINSSMHQDPSMTATALMPLLEKRHPGKFTNKQWATLARQIRTWRIAHPEYKPLYPASPKLYYD
jgi:hypothetical protein